MPPPPEILDVSRDQRVVEVFLYLDPEERRQANRDVAVAREIRVEVEIVAGSGYKKIDPVVLETLCP